MQAEISWVSRLRNPKLATIGQGTVHERLSRCTVAQEVYTAECRFFLTASYYAYQCYLGLIRNILTRYPQDGHAKKDSGKIWFNAPV